MMRGQEAPESIPQYLPPYEGPPPWCPPEERDKHPDYCSDLERFLPRNISLQRNKTSEQVMQNSEADRLGLREGDQILSVNDTNLEHIDHGEAVKILKNNTSIWMIVKYFPYGYNKTYDKGRHSNPGSPQPTR
ncbi:PDZ11-like protein [Mya arenaria]|uniref:PDZ11-like protein n=1 Tax=Mya arenaria TaxID=6604 RepID=A0ABY7DML4_MYAAR|nr:PDZ11-like protein [Mya arenaria]